MKRKLLETEQEEQRDAQKIDANIMSELTYDEHLQLRLYLSEDRSPLPENASKIYKEIHKILSDGFRENSTNEERTYAYQITSLLHITWTLKYNLLQLALTLTSPIEFNALLHEPLQPLPANVSAACQNIHRILSNGIKVNATTAEKAKANIMRKALQQRGKEEANKLVLTPDEVRKLLYGQGPLPQDASQEFKDTYIALARKESSAAILRAELIERQSKDPLKFMELPSDIKGVIATYLDGEALKQVKQTSKHAKFFQSVEEANNLLSLIRQHNALHYKIYDMCEWVDKEEQSKIENKIKEIVTRNPPLMFQYTTYKNSNDTYIKVSPLQLALEPHQATLWIELYKIIITNKEWMNEFKTQLNEHQYDIEWRHLTESPLEKLCSQLGIMVPGLKMLRAVVNKDIHMVQKLLEEGIDPNNCKTKHGSSVLHEAVSDKSYDIVNLLLTNKANPNILNNRNETPLIIAAQNHLVEAIQMLLDHGADINYQTSDKKTALHSAFELIDDEMVASVTALLKYGPDISLKDNNGHTALELAKKLEDEECKDDVDRIVEALKNYAGQMNINSYRRKPGSGMS